VADGEVVSRLPDPYGAGSKVHEYGGVAYAILTAKDEKEGTRIIFSNFEDGAVCVLDVDSGDVRTVTQSPTLRYGDFDPHPDPKVPWVLAVQEDHEKPKPADVRNYVAAINTETGEVHRIAEGADFYTFARFSPDGQHVSWKHWDHPGLWFLDTKLSRGRWVAESAAVEDVKMVAGDNGQSVAEPRWGPDGSLFFAMEPEGDNFRRLFRLRPGKDDAEKIELKGLEDTEVAWDEWTLGR
jgi:dipeptidyl aminopeptidase/acylaminoacyl peptidase